MATPEEAARTLTGGAARACLAMTDDWRFCGKATFDANGAWALYQARTIGRGIIAERENRKDGKWSRSAYRLTPFGLLVQSALAKQDPSA